MHVRPHARTPALLKVLLPFVPAHLQSKLYHTAIAVNTLEHIRSLFVPVLVLYANHGAYSVALE